MRTILGLQVTVENHNVPLLLLDGDGIVAQTHDIPPSLRRILSIVATVEGSAQLRENAPDELLVGELALSLEALDDLAEIAIAAVFHVDVKVVRRLKVHAVDVLDDVGMAQLL